MGFATQNLSMLLKHRQGSWKVSDMRLDGATFYSVGELSETRPRQHRYESLHIPYQAYLYSPAILISHTTMQSIQG